MKVLSLGIALPDPVIDNYDWASALSFFDYDAIVVDPSAAVSQLIEGVTSGSGAYRTYTEEPVEDGPSTAGAAGLTDLLRRRQDETERLLARGGLVVCFAYPDAPHPRVSGFTGCHRYYWLPAPPGCSYGRPYVSPANGVEVEATDFEHPFAPYIEQFHKSVLYRAVFNEGAAGFGEQARVIARSVGGHAAVAIDLSVGGGRVVFLPALPPRLASVDRVAVATSMVAGIRDALLLQAEEPRPRWLPDFPLPGIAEAEKEIEVAEEKIEALENQLEESRNELRGLERYRRLLWQEGKYGLDLPVRDALLLLGFTSYSRADEPAAFAFDGQTVFVETEGSGEAVGMAPHYRLRQRLERKIAGEAQRPRGLIVVNGFRNQPPGERPTQYEESLRVAAESMRYALVESTRLFDVVRQALEGDKEAAQAFAKRLLETEGVLKDEAVPVEGEKA